MKKTELRIENLVEWSGNIHAIIEIRKDFVLIQKKNLDRRSLPYHEVKPIPLTEEWLFKLGFKDQTSTFGVVRGSLRICGEYAKILYAKYIPFMVLDIGGNRIPLHHIKHVHELQNFYFALTGKELTLILE